MFLFPSIHSQFVSQLPATPCFSPSLPSVLKPHYISTTTNIHLAELTPSRPPKSKPFPILIQPLHAGLSSLKSATLFSHPIREIDAPNYSNLIRYPTDLKTIWKQVKDGSITESRVFHREVARMFANAVMYNTEDCMSLMSLFHTFLPHFLLEICILWV